MSLADPILDKIGAPILAAVFMLLFIMETLYPLRKRVQNRWKRIFTNLGIGLTALAALRLAFIPVVVWLASMNEQWEFGLNHLYELPAWMEFCIGFLLLDYTNYIWHILNHRVGFLWRFHHVHHTDLDLDLTTAIRFHFGELIASVFFRGAAIVLVGASPLLVLVYEIAFEAVTNFHHSNWKLPPGLEKAINKVIVTPRMHGIHHSIVRKETDSNYSVIFSFWDRIHGSLRLNVPQDEIIIGTPSYRDPQELTLFNLLVMPFKGQPREWKLPDGAVPQRVNPGNENELVE